MQIDLVTQELEKYLNNKHRCNDDRLVILTDDTIDREKYWVFFYTNKKYLETNNLSDMVAGNSPIIINKQTKEKHTTGTAYAIEHYMEEYEKMI